MTKRQKQPHIEKATSSVKAIIFDLAEVILYGLKGVEKHVNAKYGLKANLDTWLIQELEKLFHGEITEDEYWQAIINDQKWDVTIDNLKEAIRKNFTEVEGTREIIEKLKKNGYKLGLLSVHTKEWIEYCEEKYGYHNLFDSVLYSFEVAVSKPDRKAYELILERLHMKPTECLFIDDSLNNIEAAKRLGIRTILFKNHTQLRQDLHQLSINLG